MAITQTGKRLRIDTVLNGKDTDDKTVQTDPLLLLSVEGTEEFSKPFTYSVKLWRSPLKRPLLDAGALMKLINTPVTLTFTVTEFTEEGSFFQPGSIGFSNSVDDQRTRISNIERSGVFEDIKDEGFVHNEQGATTIGTIVNPGDAPNAFFQYSATIVPAFKMMAYETVFRVFENKTVIDIITSITQTNKFPFLNVEFDQSIAPSAFPKMPYCVQFQESTYNFLSRLMNRFGLWYYFNHNRNLQGNPPHQSTMIIGTGFPNFPSCRNNITSGENLGSLVALDQMVTTLREPSPTTIRDFGGMFHPAISRFQRVGDFNPLDPTSPFEGEATISPSRDLLKHDDTTPADADRYRKEDFHIPATSNTEAGDYVEHQLGAAEPVVATFHGSTRNPAFIPGFTFKIVGEELQGAGKAVQLDQGEISGKSDVVVFAGGAIRGGEGGGSRGDDLVLNPSGKAAPHLITYVQFGGLVVEYLNEQSFLNKLKASLFPKGTSALDVMANFTNSGLNNYLQNQLPLSLGQPPSGPAPHLLEFAFGGGLAGVASLIPLIVKLLEDDNPKSEFHCSFNAISLAPRPLGEDSFNAAPLPTDWVKTFARGPHLAVVIGPDGVEDPPQAPKTRTLDGEPPLPDIHADKLGRVRVRFPWDRRPDEKARDQFNRGNDTCWVRVSEGWAGRGFGTQFLPRIGQEVLVDFLDGDPDRPVITGRMYNADHLSTNLPFPGKEGSVDQNDLLNPVAFHDHDYRLSGVKTRSVPSRDGTGTPLQERFHLLRFNDDRDKEQYLIRSQRRLDITALEKRYESISSDRHLTVGGIDQKTHTIGGNYIAKVFKDYNLHVGDPAFPFQSGNRNTRLEAAENLSVGQSSSESIGGDWSVSVGGGPTGGGQVSISALAGTGIISLSAMTNITLMCGPASSIVITPVGISITSPKINLVSPEVSGPVPVPIPAPVPLPSIPAIPAVPQAPQDPTPADPGDKLTPPKE